MSTSTLRTRWAAIGAAVAVTLGAGGVGISHATNPGGATTYVPITPCRLVDTRTPGTVGPRSTPIGAGETYDISAHGDNGSCTGIPAGATGLELNVTALGATTGTFLALWAAGGTRPEVSHLNPQPGAPPTPNSVTTGLSTGGRFSVFNAAGSVDLLVDVVGYYSDHQHTGADIVDETLTGADVANNSLTVVDMQNEPGIAFDHRDTTFSATATAAVVVDTSMRVPGDGYVDVEVTGRWANTNIAAVDEAWCQIQKGAGPVDTNQTLILLNDRNTAQAETTFNANRVLPISAADNPSLPSFGQPISFVCREISGSVLISDIQITARYYATTYMPVGVSLSEGDLAAG